jgi:hypothetical protein
VLCLYTVREALIVLLVFVYCKGSVNSVVFVYCKGSVNSVVSVRIL